MSNVISLALRVPTSSFGQGEPVFPPLPTPEHHQNVVLVFCKRVFDYLRALFLTHSTQPASVKVMVGKNNNETALVSVINDIVPIWLDHPSQEVCFFLVAFLPCLTFGVLLGHYVFGRCLGGSGGWDRQ